MEAVFPTLSMLLKMDRKLFTSRRWVTSLSVVSAHLDFKYVVTRSVSLASASFSFRPDGTGTLTRRRSSLDL